MNIYLEKKHVKFFVKKIKDFSFITDYNLDGIQLDKQKIKIQTTISPNLALQTILPHLPQNTIISSKIDYPGKGFILCVGEIKEEDFSLFEKETIDLSIVTKKEGAIRFNAWVEYSKIEKLYLNPIVKDFSSINGKFKEKTYFILTTDEQNMDFVTSILSKYSDEFIIKEKKIYINLYLKHLSNLMDELKGHYEQIEVLDEEDF